MKSLFLFCLLCVNAAHAKMTWTMVNGATHAVHCYIDPAGYQFTVAPSSVLTFEGPDGELADGAGQFMYLLVSHATTHASLAEYETSRADRRDDKILIIYEPYSSGPDVVTVRWYSDYNYIDLFLYFSVGFGFVATMELGGMLRRMAGKIATQSGGEV